MKWTRRALIGLVCTAITVATAAQAKPPTVHLELTRSAAFGGASFADVGAYDKLTGVAHMQIDPNDPANRGIVDLDRAPRNPQGLVDYNIDLVILRPRAVTKARRVMIYDVVNRGHKVALGMLNGAPMTGVDDPGDGFAMRQGYTLVFSGWQGDITGPQLVGARFPTAQNESRPITGRIEAEMVFDDQTSDHITLPYAAASLDSSSVQVTIREHADDTPKMLAPDAWHFEDDNHIVVIRPAGSDAGAIYRIAYVAKNPKVMGLGFAATRDIVGFLRHGSAAAGNPLADFAAAPCEAPQADRCVANEIFETTVAFGMSQSGRYLRDFIWQGFNRDLDGRRVFDGVVAMIAGGRKTFTNFRFSEPGRFSRQHEDHEVPGFDFPFTYATLKDPVTGKTDGILKRCAVDGTCPKVFHIDTSAEFWQAGASLVGTGGTGHDVAFPGNVRAYMISGGTHAPGLTIKSCRIAANPLADIQIARALMVRMIDWTLGRRAPPNSRWPLLRKGDLTSLETLKTPDLSGVGLTWPKVVNKPIPPIGAYGRWSVQIPIVDADGIDLPGVWLPDRAVPDGTYIGWNLRSSGYAEGDLCNIIGGFVPFAPDRSASGADPRLSMAERYRENTRAQQMRTSAEALAREGFLLSEDIPASNP